MGKLSLDEVLKLKSQGFQQQDVYALLGVCKSTLYVFSVKHGIVWDRGARLGNTNAKVDGLGDNTIRRLTQKVVLASGRDLYTCERCGYVHKYTAHPRHHKDRDRSNNTPDNLEVLCCTCHAIEHINEREIDGKGMFCG